LRAARSPAPTSPLLPRQSTASETRVGRQWSRYLSPPHPLTHSSASDCNQRSPPARAGIRLPCLGDFAHFHVAGVREDPVAQAEGLFGRDYDRILLEETK